MRILTLIHEFPPIGGGGGRAAYDICKELVKRGHQIIVLTAHIKGIPKEEMLDGIQLFRLSSLRVEPYRASFFEMTAFILTGLWAGYRLIRIHRPDVIHVHFAVPAGPLAWLLSWLTGIPYVLTAHLGDVPGGVPEKTGKWFNWIQPLTPPIWRDAKHVVAVSEYTRGLALRHYPVEILVIPNGVDLREVKPGELKPKLPVQLVFAGRFVTQKNPLQIVKVLSKLEDLSWHCAMLGDGPLLEEVRSEIEKTRLQGRFGLAGWVTNEQVLNWFSKSDILFMPSLSEGLPVVAVQALAMGLALVVSKVGGFVDIVDDGKNGFLIESNDQEEFVRSLRTLISDSQKLMQFRQASLQKATRFDIVRVAEQYESLFQKALVI
jgi:glycosyltransferase involved in cell wall biosynthesis